MKLQVQHNSVYCYTGGTPFQPQLPTLVFIHGAQNDHSVWRLHSRYFACHGFNVLALDLPGHGRSGGSALTSIETMSAWLLALLDAVGVAKASLIGHSMGSLIAMETARCAPDSVAKLALLGNAFPMKVSDALLTMARDNEPEAIDMVVNWSYYNSVQQTATPRCSLQDDAKRLMHRLSAINPERLLYTDLSACHRYALGEAAAAVINEHQCPTLFIMGQQDRMTPAKASLKLREAIREAKVVEINRCGHSLMTEQPDAVLDALIAFL